jgi:tRNA A37 N6-isopentenylltransferase MiaA
VLQGMLDKRVNKMLEKGLLQELLAFHATYNSEL